MQDKENLENIQNKKRASVALASYNGEKYIEEQISSILKCLDTTDELIISDDGSTDKTLNIIKQFTDNDNRVKCIKGPCCGVVKNFENAISHCGGDFIFLSDQDDIWHSNKIEKILPLLKENILVCHNANIYNNK